MKKEEYTSILHKNYIFTYVFMIISIILPLCINLLLGIMNKSCMYTLIMIESIGFLLAQDFSNIYYSKIINIISKDKLFIKNEDIININEIGRITLLNLISVAIIIIFLLFYLLSEKIKITDLLLFTISTTCIAIIEYKNLSKIINILNILKLKKDK